MIRSLRSRLIAGAAAVAALATAGVVTLDDSESSTSAATTDCWDEYTLTGTTVQRVVRPAGVSNTACTVPTFCLEGFTANGVTRNRIYAPHGRPKSTCTPPPSTTTTSSPTTTVAPTTTPAPTTTATSTTTTVAPTTTIPTTAHFNTLPVGATLPTGAVCATRIRRMTENRPNNAPYNARRGTAPNATYPRATGDFVGTTDEIIQWAACKWGIDEDWVRAQLIAESFWDQRVVGDTAAGDGCTSHGLGQVRRCYHNSAFEDAVQSSAYNLDYTYAVWRSCFEGQMTWLNTVERGRDYAAGDQLGCFGVWFSGRWYTSAATNYMGIVQGHFNSRPWLQSSFPPAQPVGTPPTTTTTGAPTTTVVGTTTTTVPGTTTTVAQPGAQFIETFDNDTGLSRFNLHVFHRNIDVHDFDGFSGGSWAGDHNTTASAGLSCGDPATTRPLSFNPGDSQTVRRANSFYVCRNHMMTSMGDVDGFSIVGFSPNQVFPSVRRVCTDVNLTNLGNRQWWKMGVVTNTLYNTTKGFQGRVPGWILSDVGASDISSSLATSDRLIASWSGGLSAGFPGFLKIGDTQTQTSFNAGTDKATRHPVCLTDNRNGTITFTVASVSVTRNGSFPAGPLRVVFLDQDYTPDKSREEGNPFDGYTFHWDNVIVE